MKQSVKITIPEGVLYLSEVMKELPNGILNKMATGVGGSYIALTNSQDYLIAVPTIELIHNKSYQHPDVLGVYNVTKSKVTYTVCKDYLDKVRREEKPFKILVTYDGLPKIISWLSKYGINPYEDIKLLVDEYHKLLSDYSYRNEAIDKLLKESVQFLNCTYLSATPIQPKYIPNILKDVDIYELYWKGCTKVQPIRKKTNKPFLCVSNIIKRHKAAGYSEYFTVDGKKYECKELYFFINSVKAISDILSQVKLTAKEVKVICADTEENVDELSFPISQISDPNKPYTFITSKSFLGVDIYSDTGIAFVVSNVAKKNTLLDVATDIFQIAGRIRNTNNPFKNKLIHIYNTSTLDATPDELEELFNTKIEDTHIMIQTFNRMSDKEKKAVLKRFALDLEDDYSIYNKETNQLEFNDLKLKNERFVRSILTDIYINGMTLRKAYLNAGFNVKESQQWVRCEEEFIEDITRYSFKNVLRKYCIARDTRDIEQINYYEKYEPDVKYLVDVLGTKKIKALKYVKKHLYKLVYTESSEVQDAVSENVYKKFVLHKFYTKKDIKFIFKEIYNLLKIDKIPKATEIDNYFTTIKTSKTLDSKRVRGLLLQSKI